MDCWSCNYNRTDVMDAHFGAAQRDSRFEIFSLGLDRVWGQPMMENWNLN